MLAKGKPNNPPLLEYSPHTKPQVATLDMRIPGHKSPFLSNSSQKFDSPKPVDNSPQTPVDNPL